MCMLGLVVLRVSYCGVCICRGHFFTVPLNLTLYGSTSLNLGQKFPRIITLETYTKGKIPTRVHMLQQTPFIAFGK